ncbi:MAG: NACHT domain-containing protein [Candidatus Aminicenantes bacterium]|nr:NACHT domain-containing protein [Candidatus Aminicenantes bacterium]NIQ69920.1 NACHT domain-containing protein [Candidatus Aminicenantes bacterium]NIT25946.1 NACHT domain-containing protein [Candidatus Aminicenantes bacterium]
MAAEANGIILYTYDELLAELMDFDKYLTAVIHDFESPPPDKPKLKDLYIEQDFFPEKENKEINSFEFVQKWLTKPERKHFSLLGDYGTGKTSFARKLAYNMAKEYKEKPGSVRIPFFVDLRQCQKALSLHTLILEQLKIAGVEPVNADIFLKLLAEGKILLIFDAFDEMATMSSAEITLNNFRQLNQVVIGEAKVILTSRTHYFRDKYEVDRILKKQDVGILSEHATMLLREVCDKPEYEIVYLKEFTPHQVKEYLKKALKNKWKDAHYKIKSIYNLEDLSHRPVLLDMIVKTLPKIDVNGKAEFNVVHLYEVYTFSWIERDDHRFQIIKEGKEELVEGLACKLWQEGQKSIHYTALSDVLSRHLKSKIKTTRELEAADFEVRTAAFLVRDAGGNYSFAHKSFQEFFIARKIKKELLKGNTKVLDLRRLSLEIIFFLRHLMENDNQIIQPMAELLAQEYKKNISENALLLFYTVIKMGCLDQRFSLNEEVEFSEKDAENFQHCLDQHLPGKIQLQHAALSGVTLSRMVFKNVDFNRASLEKGILTDTMFENITFGKSLLKSSDFSHSVFKNVKFEQAVAAHCDFKSCVFENCTFVKSDFSLSNFMGSTFIDCEIEDNDFTGAGFLKSNFDIRQYKNNRFFGTGEPHTELMALLPVLNLGHRGPVYAVAVSPDNRWIVSGSGDKTVKLWDIKELETRRLHHTLERHKGFVSSVFISPDNRWIVSGSEDKTVKLWDIKDLESGRLHHTLEGHKGWVHSVFISSDNRFIVSGSSDSTVKLWDLETGRLHHTLEGHKGFVNSVFISPDNRFIVSGSDDSTVKLWNIKDLETGRLQKTLGGHEYPVISVFISPDNRFIVSGSEDKTVKLWNIKDLETGRLHHTLEGHTGWVTSVFISPDNRWIVSGSSDSTVKLWDLETGRLHHTLEGHTDWVRSVFISPDNRFIFSGSSDNTIKTWDINTGKLIYSITLLPGNQAITLFKDNKFLPSSETALQYLYYTDGLASYPAKDLPELRLRS